MPQIQITVTPQGTTTVETQGYTGSDCRTASRFLETALGTPQQEVLTCEYYAVRVEGELKVEG